MDSLCRLVGKGTRSTWMLLSSSQAFPSSSQRGERLCLFKEKGKCEDMVKVDKIQCERKMKTQILSGKETKKKYKDFSAPQGLLQPLSCSVLSIVSKSEENLLAQPLVMLQRQGEMWTSSAEDCKQPDGKKSAKQKEKYQKDIAASS